MKGMKKRFALSVSVIMVLVLFMWGISSLAAPEALTTYFKTTETDGSFADGGWYAKGGDVELKKLDGFEKGGEVSGSHRVLWAFTNSTIEAQPMLYYKLGDKAAGATKITISKHWDEEPEVELSVEPGEHVFNIFEMLKDVPTTAGYTYVVLYVGEEGAAATTNYEYMYITNTDKDGTVITKATQPTVPPNLKNEVKFQLKSYTADNAPDKYGWLMSDGAKATPNGNGFTLERKSDSVTSLNIAWVVTYEQLEKTPYLVIEIENEGRPDEGPRTMIYPYWEGVEGSHKFFDTLEAPIGANSLKGVNKYPLKFAVDSVKDTLKGDKGIAIIVAITVDARTDGTTTEPLVVKDAYLLGGEPSDEPVNTTADTNNSATTTTTAKEAAATTSKPSAGGSNNNFRTILIIVIIVVIIAVAVAVAVVVMKKKNGEVAELPADTSNDEKEE